MADNSDTKQLIDYEKTVAYFLSLQDVRFKLLAFMPVLVGGDLATLTKLDPSLELLAAVLGGLVTLGLMSYDQRNTQIYDRLVVRAKFLEEQLGFLALPLREGREQSGGAFHCRPPLVWSFWRKGITIFPVWHTLGLAVVYGACLMTWISIGLHALSRFPQWCSWPWWLIFFDRARCSVLSMLECRHMVIEHNYRTNARQYPEIDNRREDERHDTD